MRPISISAPSITKPEVLTVVQARVLTPYQLQKLVTVFGVDHVVMGTDYPYNMTESDAISHVASVKTSTRRPS